MKKPTSTKAEVFGEIQIPSAPTLKQYGMTRDEWVDMLIDQDLCCALCGIHPVCSNKRCRTTEPHGHLHTEHAHIAGWKKMPPEKRKQYVRGLVCQFDNRFVLARTMTLKRAAQVVEYLKRWEARRPR